MTKQKVGSIRDDDRAEKYCSMHHDDDPDLLLSLLAQYISTDTFVLFIIYFLKYIKVVCVFFKVMLQNQIYCLHEQHDCWINTPIKFEF